LGDPLANTPRVAVQHFLKTPQLCKHLKVGYWRIMSMIRSGKLPEPAKDTSGHYVWGPDDVEAARQALSVDYRRKQHRQAVSA
jgi:hypothetical protein